MALSQEQYAEWAANPDLAGLANFTGPVSAESLSVMPTAAASSAAPMTAAPSGFNVADYLAVNPDLVASWDSGGRMRELGPTINEAAARHWIEQGSGENRQGAPSLAVKPGELDDALRVFGDSNTVYGGQNGAYKFGSDNISALDYANLLTRGDKTADPLRVSGGQITPAPAARTGYSGPLDYESLSKLAVENPDFGMYGRSSGSYRPPELMQADPTRGFNTPYYAAYTNDGDLAGAVMAGVGQGIRLVDAKTGEVVFEGTGPEAAKQAVGIANAVSDDRGRKAAWRIEADYGDKGWVAQAAERYDPKKSGLFGTLADIALPILGAALMPVTGGLSGALAAGLGAAGGSAVSSIAQGRSLKDAALRAGLSGLGAGVVAPAVNGALGNLGAQGVTQAGTQTGTQGVAQAATGAATNAAAQSGAGTLLSEVVVNGVRTLVPAAVAAGAGAGAGSVAGGALTGGASAPTQPTQPTTPPTDLEELVVTATQMGMTPAQIVAMGVPVAVVNAFLQGTGSPAGPVDPAAPPTVEELVVTGPPNPGNLTPVVAGGVAGLMAAIASGNPSAVSDWVKANPTQAAGLGLTVGGLLLGGLGGGGGGGGGSFAVPGGPGSRGSLSPLYSASLPAPTMGAGRTPRDAVVDSRYAIERPEAAFFSNVTPRGPSQFAVPTPDANRLAGIGDINDDGKIDALDLELFRKRFSGRGYAEGGYAVGGAGDGRSDDIEARLSDGEYVIDAETVALLGNGSSKAGADALDKLRVAIRKHKGRDLAKGRFSADARDAYDYLEAR